MISDSCVPIPSAPLRLLLKNNHIIKDALRANRGKSGYDIQSSTYPIVTIPSWETGLSVVFPVKISQAEKLLGRSLEGLHPSLPIYHDAEIGWTRIGHQPNSLQERYLNDWLWW